jgi:hypothetical protein
MIWMASLLGTILLLALACMAIAVLEGWQEKREQKKPGPHYYQKTFNAAFYQPRPKAIPQRYVVINGPSSYTVYPRQPDEYRIERRPPYRYDSDF